MPPALHQKLHEAFAEKALDNPSVPAISSWEGEWTYAELDRASTRLAEYLTTLHDRHSPSPPSAVLSVHRSCIGIITLLAILKAGFTCVAVDSETCLAQVVQEVDPKLVCVSPIHAEQFLDFKGTVVTVDEELLDSLQQTEQGMQSLASSTNEVAFVQYTKGFTGPPKGVKQGHTGLYTGIFAQGQALGYDIDSRVLHSNPYTTSAGISEVFGAFLYGGCLVIRPEEKSLVFITEMINKQEVTHASFSPVEAMELDPMSFWHLQTVTLQGENFAQEDVDKWGLETELVRTYGTAETGVHVSACKAPSPHISDLSNIGAPFVASFWVVEQGNVQRLAPLGAVGELVIGGPTLALGYTEITDVTSSGFLVNPDWAAADDANERRFFVTGDLVRQLGNGEYIFCGRKQRESHNEVELDQMEERAGLVSLTPPFSLLGSEESVKEANQAAATTCGVSSDMITDIYPVTPMQEGLFALSNKKSGAFMKQDVFELHSNLDVEKFRRAWVATIQQSPILRTRFIMTESLRVLQVVVSESPPCQVASDLESYLERDLKKPMLFGDSLFRYAITAESDQKRYLVVTMHHAIFDGWTLGLIFDRVKQNLERRKVSIGTPFSSFVKYIQELDHERTDQFWAAQLENASKTVFPALPSVSYHPVPNDTVERVLDFRKTTGSKTTASTLVQAAWALTVAVYADSEDVVFGSTVFGRVAPVPGIVDMMGPTVATVPFRMHFLKVTKLGAFVQQVQDQSAMAIPHEQAGMYRIQQLTAATRTACSFQTALIVQSVETLNGLETLGCRRVNEMRDSYQPYALNVEVGLQKDGAEVSVLFDNRVIDKPQVERVVSMFSEVLHRLSTADPDTSIGSVMSITITDMDELNSWNEVSPDPVQEYVHQAFSEQALLRPEAPAIAAWDGGFTYADLDSLSDTLAKYLFTSGVQAEKIVPLHFEKSKWSIVSMLAVLKAGGTCLSFDVSHPPDRLIDMVKAVGAEIMLSGKAPPSKVVDFVNQVVTVNKELFECLNHGETRRSWPVSPRNRAFIVFTSGSTGNPKGIELEHRAVCFSSRAYAKAVNIGPGSRCLQYSSFAFDVHITDIFTALLSGACCCILSEEDRVSNVSHAMSKLGVTHADITPTVANLLRPEDVSDLKSLVVGGEPLTTETVRRWGSRVKLVNMYSQSETSNWVTHHAVPADTVQPLNIGRGDGMSTWIVDQHNESRLAPIGCTGELFVSGPALARGYLNDTANTMASFIDHPPWLPGTQPSALRVYRTGDLVRYNSDGTLVYVGRKDAQIKLHGQRLELAEVDHNLMDIPQVKACLTVHPKTGLCKGRCVAVLSLRDFGGDGSESLRMIEPSQSHRALVSGQLAAIRDRLSESLARWMVPTFWIVVRDIPRNVSGKSDRKKAQSFVECLGEAEFQRAADLLADSYFRPPKNALEELLQGIWSSVLNLPLDQISTTASFWRLGGDSITAMQVVARCRAEGLTLSVHNLLNSKSLSELADLANPSFIATDVTGKLEHNGAFTDSLKGSVSTSATAISDSLFDSILKQASVKPSNVEMAFLASDYQVSALEQLLLSFRGDLTYHTFDIPKPTDYTRLALACVEVVNSHPLLRSVFVAHERQVYQVVLKSSFVDLTEESNDAELATLMDNDRKLNFRLGQPMIWFKLARRHSSHDCDSLVIRLPHCLYDAYTLASLVSDLEQAYFSNNVLEWPIDILSYVTYRESSRREALSYWRRYLEDSTANQIVSRSVPPFQHGRQHTLSSTFRVDSLKCHGITSATVVKSAWGFLLTELFSKDDVVFGELTSGRGLDFSGIESMDVVCALTVPLRIKLDTLRTVLDLLRNVQDRQLASMPFEIVGETSILQECTSWPKWTRFGSVINYIPLPTSDDAKPRAFRETGIHGRLNPNADLNIQCHPLLVTSELDPNFRVQITFDENRVSHEFVAKVMDRFRTTIRRFTDDVSSSLDSLKTGSINGYSLPLKYESPTNRSTEVIKAKLSTKKDTESILKNVQSVWDRVIGESEEIDTPFFVHWEALIAAAHFAWLYQESGVDLTMEDILDAPTIREQVHLLANRGQGVIGNHLMD